MAQEREQARAIEALRQEIAHTRTRLARDVSGLAYELDFPLKIRKSFQRHSKLWVSAATILGTLFTLRMPGRRKTVRIKTEKGGWVRAEKEKEGLLAAGVAMGGLRLLGTLLRPLVVSFVTKKLTRYAATRR